MLIVLANYPLVQLYLAPMATILPMLVYYIIYHPFREGSSNWFSIYNEFVVIVVFLSLIVINTTTFGYNNTSNIGWVLIGLIMVSFAATWCIMLPGIAKALWAAVARLFTTPQPTQKKETEAQLKEVRSEAADKELNIAANKMAENHHEKLRMRRAARLERIEEVEEKKDQGCVKGNCGLRVVKRIRRKTMRRFVSSAAGNAK